MDRNTDRGTRIGDGVKREKEKLSQYRMLLGEIKADRERLAQLAGRLLRANPAGLPLGIDSEGLAGYRDKINENLERCVTLLEEIQTYINSIEDSEMRRIFTLHYINGHSWQRVAFDIGEYDESYPRRKHNAYIAKRLKATSGYECKA